jgi:hypothetical protein
MEITQVLSIQEHDTFYFLTITTTLVPENLPEHLLLIVKQGQGHKSR